MKNMGLKAAREASDKTQAEAAKESMLSETQYQNIECKRSEPRVRTAIRIAKALNKDVGDMEELFGAAPDGNQVG